MPQLFKVSRKKKPVQLLHVSIWHLFKRLCGILETQHEGDALQFGFRIRQDMRLLVANHLDAMLDAANYIRTIETRQGLQVACLQEIAWENGWMTADEVRESCNDLKKTGYGQYLLKLVENK